MGRDHNETGGRRKGSKGPKKLAPDFWSFHPTEKDKEALAAFSANLPDLWAAMGEEVRRGITFTLTRAKTNDSVCLVARDAFASFGEGQALSVFHVDTDRAAVGMLYCLRVLFPKWPSQPAAGRQHEMDW